MQFDIMVKSDIVWYGVDLIQCNTVWYETTKYNAIQQYINYIELHYTVLHSIW